MTFAGLKANDSNDNKQSVSAYLGLAIILSA